MAICSSLLASALLGVQMTGKTFFALFFHGQGTLLNVTFGNSIQNFRDVGFIPVVFMPVDALGQFKFGQMLISLCSSSAWLN